MQFSILEHLSSQLDIRTFLFKYWKLDQSLWPPEVSNHWF